MKIVRFVIISAVIVVAIYYGFGYLNTYVGWYSRKTWLYRLGTTTMQESKARGVFVKELHFKTDNFSGNLDSFSAYIEKGYTCTKESIDCTVIWTNTKYPYQFNYTLKPSASVGVIIRNDQLSKFDSSNATRGFLKTPSLPDTIILEVGAEGVHGATIKVW